MHQICARSTILYGSETWCFSEREAELLRTEKTVLRTMCIVRLIDRKETKELMQMMGVTLPIERMVKVAAVGRYGHDLRREEGNILKKALNFEATGRKKCERRKAT